MTAPHSLVAPPSQPVAVRRALEFVQAVARSQVCGSASMQSLVADDWRREARDIAAALAGEPSGT